MIAGSATALSTPMIAGPVTSTPMIAGHVAVIPLGMLEMKCLGLWPMRLNSTLS